MKNWLLLLFISIYSHSSWAGHFEDYLQEKVTDYHFQTLTYQFRFADSYQYVASENYDLQAIEDHAKEGDPYANVILYFYYSDTKKHKEAEQASLRIFVQTVSGQEFLTLQNAMSLFALSEKDTAKEGAYLIYLKEELGIQIDEQRLSFLLEKHGEKKVEQKLNKLHEKIARLTRKLPEKSIVWAVEPLRIQKRKEG